MFATLKKIFTSVPKETKNEKQLSEEVLLLIERYYDYEDNDRIIALGEMEYFEFCLMSVYYKDGERLFANNKDVNNSHASLVTCGMFFESTGNPNNFVKKALHRLNNVELNYRQLKDLIEVANTFDMLIGDS